MRLRNLRNEIARAGLDRIARQALRYPRRSGVFARPAGRVRDLYRGQWQGKPLGKHDDVLSSDEKTSIQVRRRIHEGTPGAPDHARRVEFEYERGGALAYLAARDVRRAKIFGR